MADIEQTLFGIIKMFQPRESSFEVPNKSEILERWVLPMMASSFKSAEDELETKSMIENIMRLKRNQERGV